MWQACLEYGEWLLELVIPLRDSNRAAQLFMDSCISGLGRGCMATGDLFILGDGVVRDAPSAALWYELGCDFGDWESCFRAAIGYEIGSGVAEDPKAGVMFFKMSCEGEYGAACTRLGWMHVRGTAGEKKDLVRAGELFAIGCNFGHGGGCYEHGMNLMSVSKKKRSFDEIERIFVAGCGANSSSACLAAGDLFKDEDPSRAVKFFQSGCELGERSACKFQLKLQKKL
jgi:TPR repeat protein